MEEARDRVAQVDWAAVEASLDERGFATIPGLVTAAECESLVALYDDERRFRTRVEMARFRFGLGEYKYFAAPLPPLVETLRQALYPRLAPIANRWVEEMGLGQWPFPPTLAAMLELCRRHGQGRPTPLLLRYEAGGYNCLHQDLYGEVAFPLQVTAMLSRGGRDYEGGEFILVEQRPRAQSRGEAIVLKEGEAVVFTSNQRPVRGARGHYRVRMRHA